MTTSSAVETLSQRLEKKLKDVNFSNNEMQSKLNEVQTLKDNIKLLSTIVDTKSDTLQLAHLKEHIEIMS